MKHQVTKAPKVALCRKCCGTGHYRRIATDGTFTFEQCPQCEGSGRVTVSAVMEYAIRPYKQKER